MLITQNGSCLYGASPPPTGLLNVSFNHYLYVYHRVAI